MPPRSDPVDARADRAVMGTVAVITLGAFVFRQSWLIPVLALLLGAGALLGPAANPFHRLFAAAVGPRLKPATAQVAAHTVRDQDALGFALLATATLFLLVALGGLAWILTLGEALVAVVAATTGIHLAETIRDRWRRPRSG